MKVEKKITANGRVTDVKQETRNGQPVGIIEGYLATWDEDRGKDRFEQGAFAEAIAELKAIGRQLRMKYNHWTLIGGFPAETLREDSIGLFGSGEVNLNKQLGLEVYSLSKQGVLSDFSVGWSMTLEDMRMENDVRVIEKSGLWESSIVDEPMNPKAVVTSVKSIDAMPKTVASLDVFWDEKAALSRLEEAHIEPTFLLGERFLLTDIVDGKEAVIPRAVFSARAIVSGARGGLKSMALAEEVLVKHTVNELYERLDLEPPFEEDGEKGLSITEAKGLPDSLLYDMIRNGRLGRKATEWLVGLRSSMPESDGPTVFEHEPDDLSSLTALKKALQESTI